MPIDFPINKHFDGQNLAELKRFKHNIIPADPTGVDLVEGIIWFVEDAKKWKYFDGTELKTLGGEGGRKRGSFDASAGAVPTAADATVDPGVEIKDGDYFVITVAGDIAGLPNEESLEIGDLLYANMDSPATAADFYAVQTNIKLADNPVESEVLTGVALEEFNPLGGLPIFPTKFVGISSIEIIETATGARLTDSFSVVYTPHSAPPASNAAPYESATIESLASYDDLTVILSGW